MSALVHMNGRPTRLARIRARFTSASDVWLAVRMFGWALVLPILKHVVPVRSLARLMYRPPPKSSNRQIVKSSISIESARLLAFARWAARLVRPRAGGNCLERGLIAFRYLGAAGAAPTLVVGLGPDDRGGMVGHAWVLLDGRVAGESEEAIRAYTPVFAFAADGTLIDPPLIDPLLAPGPDSAAAQGRVT